METTMDLTQEMHLFVPPSGMGTGCFDDQDPPSVPWGGFFGGGDSDLDNTDDTDISDGDGIDDPFPEEILLDQLRSEERRFQKFQNGQMVIRTQANQCQCPGGKRALRGCCSNLQSIAGQKKPNSGRLFVRGPVPNCCADCC